MTTTITPSNDSWRMAKATAPMVRTLAGRRLFPFWAVVHHRDHAATEPRILGRAEARPYYDGFSWWMVEKVFKADSFLALRR
ncbi:hypothetical protein ACFVDI_13395 [Nocardioides sp. NPDC057767]|uniref:hypothetical protein n=1 Tax=unclassified Nocardioides TaxID=2615069 RepID=UPI00366E1890